MRFKDQLELYRNKWIRLRIVDREAPIFFKVTDVEVDYVQGTMEADLINRTNSMKMRNKKNLPANTTKTRHVELKLCIPFASITQVGYWDEDQERVEEPKTSEVANAPS